MRNGDDAILGVLLEIELCIFNKILPVNTLAILNRIKRILEENKTNTTLCLNEEALAKVQACILILWEISKFQSWNVMQEWERVREELKPVLIAQKLTE